MTPGPKMTSRTHDAGDHVRVHMSIPVASWQLLEEMAQAEHRTPTMQLEKLVMSSLDQWHRQVMNGLRSFAEIYADQQMPSRQDDIEQGLDELQAQQITGVLCEGADPSGLSPSDDTSDEGLPF